MISGYVNWLINEQVVILLERMPNEVEIPLDVLRHYNILYDEAYKGWFFLLFCFFNHF